MNCTLSAKCKDGEETEKMLKLLAQEFKWTDVRVKGGRVLLLFLLLFSS